MANHRTAVIIDLDAIKYNVANIKAKIGKAGLLGVIKADAYGHGVAEVAKVIENDCSFFGVAVIEEAVELRKAGFDTPILVLGRVEPYYSDLLVKYDIRPTIFSFEDAKSLSDEAVKQGKTAQYHLAVDTGMSRIGFQVTEADADICKEIAMLPCIEAEGIFTHFATADEKDLSKTLIQKEKFELFVKMLADRDINPPIKHANNSAGIMNFDEHYDMVRAGIVLYGMYPSEDVKKSDLCIKPAMKWVAEISHLKELEKGREISYGGTYTTKGKTLVATVPVGYADGYPRSLSNIGKVMVKGKAAPIIGRVCMDQFMIDVTDIHDVKVGDEITLVGDGLTMEEVSNAAHSFNYELPCRISRRVPKIYLKDGEEYKTVSYLLD
ncbi:MAG: alanine racemase [Clostridia bacterium]|nr:alanine racemase [Clostridia bacterium]